MPRPFRWWSEKGILANMATVGEEFVAWRRLRPVRIVVLGAPGCGADQLGANLGRRFNIPTASLYKQVDELKNLPDLPLGQQLRESCDQIAAALANPKAAGPFVLPGPLAQQAVEVVLEEKRSFFRGWTLTDFPQAVDEATEFFLRDVPPSPDAEAAPPPKKGEAAPPAEKEVKPEVLPDFVVILSGKEEECLNRAKEEGLQEAEFGKRMDRWKKENPEEGTSPLVEFFRERLQIEPLLLNVDEVSLDEMEQQVAAQLLEKRPVFNFMLPQQAGEDDEDVDPSSDRRAAADDEAARAEAEERRRKKEADEKLEILRKDELQRLEKHSEPLRQYLTALVQPTLTSALIEVCRESPEDPIGYLAEYLAVYSKVSQQRARNSRRRSYAAAGEK